MLGNAVVSAPKLTGEGSLHLKEFVVTAAMQGGVRCQFYQ
jgi:hypothetical protein